MSDRKDFTTGVGRIVQGNAHTPYTKDGDGNPLVIKNGPNAGQPRNDFFFSIAIAKTDASYQELWATIYEAGRIGHPTQFNAQGQLTNPDFSWKITDGDDTKPNKKGKVPCEREGFAGHWVLSFSGSFAPDLYKEQNGDFVKVVDEGEKKALFSAGNFVRVNGSAEGNKSSQNPGVYLNHNMVQFVGYGEPIRGGADPTQAFGTAAAAPAGMSATPLSTSTMSAPSIPATTAAAPAAGALAAPIAGAPAAGAVAPKPEFLTPAAPAAGATAAPAPSAPAAPVAVVEKKYSIDGVVYTEAQLTGAGWTVEQMAALTPA